MICARQGTRVKQFDPFDILNFDPTHVTMKESNHAMENGLQFDHDTIFKSQMKPSTKPLAEPPNEQEGTLCLTETCKTLTALFKQYSKQLLNLLEPHVGSFSATEMCLRVSVSYHDLHVFRQYTESDTASVHEVHESLSHMLQDAMRMDVFESRIYWLEEKLGISSASLAQIAIIMSSAALLVLALPSLGLKSVFYISVLFLFAVSAAFTWFELFQKEQAQQGKILTEDLAQRCPSLANLSWFERLGNYVSSTFTFQDENCREFYEATVVNPMFKVNPLEACAVALVKTLITPLEIVGTGVKRFLIGLLKDLPLQFQIYLMTFLGVVTVIAPFVACGYRIRIPFLLSIEPSPAKPVDQSKALQAIQNSLNELERRESARHIVTTEINTLCERMASLSIRASGDEPWLAAIHRNSSIALTSQISTSRATFDEVPSTSLISQDSITAASSSSCENKTIAVSNSEELPSSSTDTSTTSLSVPSIEKRKPESTINEILDQGSIESDPSYESVNFVTAASSCRCQEKTVNKSILEVGLLVFKTWNCYIELLYTRRQLQHPGRSLTI